MDLNFIKSVFVQECCQEDHSCKLQLMKVPPLTHLTLQQPTRIDWVTETKPPGHSGRSTYQRHRRWDCGHCEPSHPPTWSQLCRHLGHQNSLQDACLTGGRWNRSGQVSNHLLRWLARFWAKVTFPSSQTRSGSPAIDLSALWGKRKSAGEFWALERLATIMAKKPRRN